jgi:hypothetical protein
MSLPRSSPSIALQKSFGQKLLTSHSEACSVQERQEFELQVKISGQNFSTRRLRRATVCNDPQSENHRFETITAY